MALPVILSVPRTFRRQDQSINSGFDLRSAASYGRPVLFGIGAGIVAVGAALLLGTIWFPPRDWVGAAERRRQKRNANIAMLASGLTSFAGAALLLIGVGIAGAAIGLLAGAALYYFILVAETHREWSFWRSQIRKERGTIDGKVSGRTANETGVLAMPAATQALSRAPVEDVEVAERAEALAVRRARWRWAFAHPFGSEEKLSRKVRQLLTTILGHR